MAKTPKSVKVQVDESFLEQTRDLDRRRQIQIENQVGIIDRLLEGDGTYDSEMKKAQEDLATSQQREEAAQRRIKDLEAELAEHGPGGA